MKRILILGGGAAGILAAIAAAQEAGRSAQVLLADQNPRLGKKLLATGNGRCNLDNANPAPSRYFSSDRETLEQMLASIRALDLSRWFAAHGLLTRTDEAGRVYPYSNQAADLLDLLLFWLEELRVQVRTGQRVKALSQTQKGWSVLLESGEQLQGEAVICALGGKAGPQFGTDGSAFSIARQTGCLYEPIYPCLVPLACEKKQVADLAGIRVKGEALLYERERLLAREEGEIQFTDYGLSGIAIMNLSGFLSPGRDKGALSIRLDLFPQHTADDLTDLFQHRARMLGRSSAQQFFTGLLQRRVGLALWRAAGLGSSDRPLSALRAADWAALARTAKGWTFTGLSPKEWKLAQTTGGGVRLSLLDPHTFQCKGAPGLYFAGETLDCAGQCGGFNLHWAFGSGILAGQAAARAMK